ncbi:MAG TPA: PBP1A family penicillin-binding protein [Pyrinomonadaceae bacterium]|nr:PBP1A family penicillin-binding protein [Pyrinomonadaceae bacterium]
MPPKGWVKAKRVSAYKAPPATFLQRAWRMLFNGWTISLALLALLGVFLTLTYFWFEFSDRIDRRLMGGEVFTPYAGIYSAPKNLRVNEELTPTELLDYLRSAGYIDKNIKAEHSRGRFTVIDGGVRLEPGLTAIVDGEKIFPSLDVYFGRSGKQVTRIVDLLTGSEIERASLEPKQLSTIAAEGDGRRRTVGFNDLPGHLIDAIVVTEDRAFFDHYGVNFRGIARALWRRYEGEDTSPLSNQGGSSITQQLVKNLLLTREQTLERKVTEAYMSVILETRLSKQDIFTLYANQIYLGQQSGASIYGVGEAANAYFGKDVSQLTLSESAFLAGIIRSPNRYSPYKNPERVRERRNQVLQSMLEEGKITSVQYSQAYSSTLELKQAAPSKDHKGMPYFSQYVVDELPNVVSDPEALQHLRVYTSIDPDLQKLAYDTVASRLERMERTFNRIKPGSLNAALVAIRPKTGEIVAMVGGRNYNDNQFNRATMAMRQPGSVFKPFVYAAALNSPYEGSRIFTAATVLKDEKKIFTFGNDSYSPNNYGDFFSNKEITLRDALVKSKNTVTVDVAMQVNVGRVMNLAHKAGLPKVSKAYPSMALGTAEATPLQVASAYTMFANLGDRVAPMPITKVTKGDGQTAAAPKADRRNVVRPDVAYITNDILKDVVNRGTAAQLAAWGLRNVAGKSAIAGKTGTSRDGWFAGYTPEIVCVVYVGYDNNDDLGLKGSDSAMPIWADFMQAALKLHPEWNGDWAMPAGIRRAEIDIRNGSLVRELDAVEVQTEAPVPTPSPIESEDPDLSAWKNDLGSEPRKVFVTEVPAEFRRVEMFISGTVPAKAMLPMDVPESLDSAVPEPTPLTETWSETAIEDRGRGNSPPGDRRPGQSGSLNVIVCPTTNMRATVNCPISESRSYSRGAEPKDFCPIHSSKQ